MRAEDSSLMQSIDALSDKPNTKLSHLPSDKGLPIVGRTFELLRRPMDLLEELFAKHGPVFQTKTFMQRSVLFGAPDAAELLLIDREHNFSNRKGWYRFKPLFERGILLRDFDEHRVHRRPMQAALQS